MKVLVVEDERKISSFVRRGLEEQGISVELSANGDDALARVSSRPFDAVVLDVMLPGRDGLSVLRQLREQKNPVPVILLTARSALNERIEGLNCGADDYLTKPFYIEELIARLHAVTRRNAGEANGIIQVRNLTVNLLTRAVDRGGHVIELTPREFTLLTYLLRSPGRVLTRTQICEHVWNYHFDSGTNLVEVYIQRLRKKIGDDPKSPLIETVRGVGYRMAQR